MKLGIKDEISIEDFPKMNILQGPITHPCGCPVTPPSTRVHMGKFVLGSTIISPSNTNLKHCKSLVG